jgi:hypothetical protein
MFRLRIIVAPLILIANSAVAVADFRILDDQGGRIGSYIGKFEAIRNRGERVIVDGVCASACTVMLGIIPPSRTCVTPGAVFEFHAAWDPVATGGTVESRAGNRLLWAYYPPRIRSWISSHGGLSSRPLELRGGELIKIYRACP